MGAADGVADGVVHEFYYIYVDFRPPLDAGNRCRVILVGDVVVVGVGGVGRIAVAALICGTPYQYASSFLFICYGASGVAAGYLDAAALIYPDPANQSSCLSVRGDGAGGVAGC